MSILLCNFQVYCPEIYYLIYQNNCRCISLSNKSIKLYNITATRLFLVNNLTEFILIRK